MTFLSSLRKLRKPARSWDFHPFSLFWSIFIDCFVYLTVNLKFFEKAQLHVNQEVTSLSLALVSFILVQPKIIKKNTQLVSLVVDYRRILRLRSRFPANVQVPNFCAGLVSLECLVTGSTHAQKPKFAANPWNRLAVTEFPASVSADSVLKVSRTMKLGPDLIICVSHFTKLKILLKWMIFKQLF